MLFVDLKIQEEINNLVDKHVDEITTLEEIFKFSDFIVNDDDFNYLPEDDLYIKLSQSKKLAQLTLNSYHSINEYKSCRVLTRSNPAENKSETLVQYPERSCLISYICDFIQCYCALRTIENGHKSIRNKMCEPEVNVPNCSCSDRSDNTLCRTHRDKSKIISRFRRVSSEKRDYIRSIDEDKYLNDQWNKNNPLSSSLTNKSEWECLKCTFVNQPYFSSCIVCYNFPSIGSDKQHRNIEPAKHESWPIDRMTQNAPIIDNCRNKKARKEDSVGQILNLFRRIRYRKNIVKSDEWKCTKCGLQNKSSCCEACFNAGPYSDKWRCENCLCLNKYRNEKCDLCQQPNRNITRCLRCEKAKIAIDREFCDDCFSLFLRWQCRQSKCRSINDAKEKFCMFCGIHRSKNYREIKGQIINIDLS